MSTVAMSKLGPSPVTEYLRRVVEDLRPLTDGTVNNSVPELAAADENIVGIAVATVDGALYQAGDTKLEFCIQSISKAFTYAQALTDRGPEGVFEKIDVEPSGDAFNEISLQPETGRPANPMINAGAIAATSLVRNTSHGTRMERILRLHSRCAGRQLRINKNIQSQEHKAGDRNRALGWLLASRGIIEGDPTGALEDYFGQCSIMLNCVDLARMGATLAAGGRNPVTGERVLDPEVVSDVLSVMSTCGMYDDAGRWAIRVGLPAKSGVSGGVVAVLPGQLAVAVFSPPLDRHGNSVRGVAACERLTKDLDLHFARTERNGHSTVRSEYALAEAPSLVRRNEAATEVLDAHGEDARIIELQGDLRFAGAETAVRTVRDAARRSSYVLVDIRQVDDMARFVLPMLSRTAEQIEKTGHHMVLVAEKSGENTRNLEHPLTVFATRAEALTWAEDQILERFGGPGCTPDKVHSTRSELLSTLGEEDVERIRSRTESVDWKAGTTVLRTGQKFNGVYMVTSGNVEVSRRSPQGDRVELEVIGPGMSFGEIALGTNMRHLVSFTALTDVSARRLSPEAIQEIEEEDPRLALRWWRAVSQQALLRIEERWRQQAGETHTVD
ncbi:glutaminase A [Kocuria marina subsp. indica]|uniref:glutaminase A n=1 Tax=Kocuria TaxID=57493 RepID=UPI00103B4001|nr:MULTISPECIES: glutaminase A [Kocuria]MDT0120464.1 glutaminase A [Kocuria sp. PD6]QBJ22111.1 glutaminase A [Kocuria indica]